MLTLLLLVLTQFDGGAADATLKLEVTGVRSATGSVRVALYRAQDGFNEPRAKAFRAVAVPAKKGTVQLEVNVPPGAYALSVFHDENDDERIDTGFLGIPVEGFAFSKNAMGMFGPPSFAQASVTHPQAAAHQVTLRY